LLLYAGFYFLENEDFDTAATLYVGALGRESIEMNFDNIPVTEASPLFSLYSRKFVELSFSGVFQPVPINDAWFMASSNEPSNRNL